MQYFWVLIQHVFQGWSLAIRIWTTGYEHSKSAFVEKSSVRRLAWYRYGVVSVSKNWLIIITSVVKTWPWKVKYLSIKGMTACLCIYIRCECRTMHFHSWLELKVDSFRTNKFKIATESVFLSSVTSNNCEQVFQVQFHIIQPFLPKWQWQRQM